MVKIVGKLPKFLRKDRRKYPILKDEGGKSARARCFEAFDAGGRPVEVAKNIGISLKTSCQYHWQWKKLPKHFEDDYQAVKTYLKERPEARNNIIKTLSRELDLPEYRIRLWLESPWGLKQIKSGKWRKILERKRRVEESRSFKIHMLIIKGYKNKGLTIDEIYEALDKLVDEKSKMGKTQSSNKSDIKPIFKKGQSDFYTHLQ